MICRYLYLLHAAINSHGWHCHIVWVNFHDQAGLALVFSFSNLDRVSLLYIFHDHCPINSKGIIKALKISWLEDHGFALVVKINNWSTCLNEFTPYHVYLIANFNVNA